MTAGPLVTVSLCEEGMSSDMMGLLEVLDMLGAVDLRRMDVETGAFVAIRCPDIDMAEKVAANLRCWHLTPVVVPGEWEGR